MKSDSNRFHDIMKTQLSEREVMIYLMVKNGNRSFRKAGIELGISHDNVRKIYESAKVKVERGVRQGDFGPK